MVSHLAQGFFVDLLKRTGQGLELLPSYIG